MAYHCPICSFALEQQSNSYRCPQGHQFDIAKEGYVNLLPVQQKKSKDPGDNQLMTQARRRFLSSGHYDALRHHVAQQLNRVLSPDASAILDLGCGEGFYTQGLHEELSARANVPEVYGIDISKVAVRYAAKRYRQCRFSVSSSYHLPFADQSLDGVVRIYAPSEATELQRVLKANGLLLTVTPAQRHLYQLREQIYTDVRLHAAEPELIEGFTLLENNRLSHTMSLSGQEAHDLLLMTPFAWKASDEFKQRLVESRTFECEADFSIALYQKNATVSDE
ncbi:MULTISPECIES: 23S rRNA (guanine(745)-N(1))-methyltransferase [unclassified Vibrio]|uniref:23S rRNA (Guanine(745)-N(1))-methyltransferase n=1 Tax=Vibrio sp. HB236076 TaxID=3232307 RepID=A0AB39HJG9_9VIBR|nr:23S rRNA (guanine(745)-N(1))-methyltransferase [Vibrio sp. HB161653]MDP5254718.1 23S rRNA (guanine(745)-N(1))-methyltransferase [Vibrio sp. HB161653]